MDPWITQQNVIMAWRSPHSHIWKRSSFHKLPNAPLQHLTLKSVSPQPSYPCFDKKWLKAKLRQPCMNARKIWSHGMITFHRPQVNSKIYAELMGWSQTKKWTCKPYVPLMMASECLFPQLGCVSRPIKRGESVEQKKRKERKVNKTKAISGTFGRHLHQICFCWFDDNDILNWRLRWQFFFFFVGDRLRWQLPI